MPLYWYTGTLADIGLRSLEWASPLLRVRPEREAFGPNGLISQAPMDITVEPGTGAFSMRLLNSADLSPECDYIIEVGRFENSIDGQRFLGVDTWRFTALPGGGPIVDQDGSPYDVFIGPPIFDWPEGTPPGLYIQGVAPNAWGIKTEEA